MPLTRDVSCDSACGDYVIFIDADRVTLDLNRFTTRGDLWAIGIAPDRTHVTIRNGSAVGGPFAPAIVQRSTGSVARVTISDVTFPAPWIEIASGAGFLIPITGNIMRMPGLPAHPASEKISIDNAGNITGLM